MKKIIIIGIIALLSISLIHANAIASLMAYKGKLDIQRASTKLKYKNGELLMDRDILRTGEESFAAYKYADASTTVKMFSNSVATLSGVKSGKELNKAVEIKKGNIHSSIQKGKGSYQVITPTTVASVKGTEFFTKVEANGKSTFVVSDGEVEVKILATNESVSVGKGKTAVVNIDGGVLLRDSFAGEIEELEQAAAAESVPPQIHKIIIPMYDANGVLKYIEISY